ncbi:hypothetical protein L1887_48995 [Cichorium endivia]|nr:hypothetical protein L1887_48995 [Cichorium endivia]
MIDAESSAAFELKANFIALRLQLLALILHDEQIFKQLDRDMATSVLKSLEALIQLYGSRSATQGKVDGAASAQEPAASESEQASKAPSSPKWLASLILSLVGILGFSEDIVETKVDDSFLDAPAEADSSATAESGKSDSQSAPEASTVQASASTSEKPSLSPVKVGSVPISDALFQFAIQLFREAPALERNDLLAAYRLLTLQRAP